MFCMSHPRSSIPGSLPAMASLWHLLSYDALHMPTRNNGIIIPQYPTELSELLHMPLFMDLLHCMVTMCYRFSKTNSSIAETMCYFFLKYQCPEKCLRYNRCLPNKYLVMIFKIKLCDSARKQIIVLCEGKIKTMKHQSTFSREKGLISFNYMDFDAQRWKNLFSLSIW